MIGVRTVRNDISLVIPLSALAGAPNLSPDEIVTALTKSVEAQEELVHLREQVEKMQKIVAAYGRNLRLILDEVNEPMEKAQALRKLSKDMEDTAKLISNGQ